MKYLILPLLAAIALPTAVNAESYWLILSSGSGDSAALEKIEMASMEQCKALGLCLICRKESGVYALCGLPMVELYCMRQWQVVFWRW